MDDGWQNVQFEIARFAFGRADQVQDFTWRRQRIWQIDAAEVCSRKTLREDFVFTKASRVSSLIVIIVLGFYIGARTFALLTTQSRGFIY